MALSPEFIALQESVLGRYSLERELGRGGMGTVYLARDVRNWTGRSPSSFSTPTSRPILPRALPLSARGPDGGPPGAPAHRPDLRRRSRGGPPLPGDGPGRWGDAWGHGCAAAARCRLTKGSGCCARSAWALGYAHAQGVVHRDLTLENVLIERDSGRVLLGDFGLATALEAVEAQPRFGTPGYLAPEVIRGEPATPASDLYALGVVDLACVRGARAVRGGHGGGRTRQASGAGAAAGLAPLARGASRRLVAAVEQCLAKDADARPADAATLLGLLERAPEPVAIAPALRHWFTRWERFRPIYSLATPILALQTWLLVLGSPAVRVARAPRCGRASPRY